jgi:hypothetical protein
VPVLDGPEHFSFLRGPRRTISSRDSFDKQASVTRAISQIVSQGWVMARVLNPAGSSHGSCAIMLQKHDDDDAAVICRPNRESA